MAYRSVRLCAAPHAAEKIVNRNTVRMIRGLRPKMSLDLDKMIRKPIRRSDLDWAIASFSIPEYVSR